MKQDERAAFHEALQSARIAAFEPGEFVGQESFMRAGDIRALARHAGIDAGTRVMDLCCGVAGPGLTIARETGCRYLGVDYSASALSIARRRANGTNCRFVQARIPPVPRERCDVVLLLATLLAFPDKPALIDEIAAVLPVGGRFACTVLAGTPLSDDEQAAMPDADTVYPVPLGTFVTDLRHGGFAVTWQREATDDQATVAAALLAEFESRAAPISDRIGARASAELVLAHRLWVSWLRAERVRAIELTATRI